MSKNKTKVSVGKNSFLNPKVLIVILMMATIGAYLATQIFAASASLSLVPSATTINAGSNFTVAVRVNSGTDTINAITAKLTYDATKLQYVSVNDAGSPLSMAIETSPSSGVLNIVRAIPAVTGTPTVPISGDQLVTTVTFRALATGTTLVSLAADSTVASSVDNTNILTIRNGTTLTIADTAAPTVPASLTAPTINFTSIGLAWAASTDNIGVTSYIIYRNGVQVGTSATTSYSNTGLTPGTSYQFRVAARDAAGNTSAQSTILTVSTLTDTVAPTVPGKPTSPSQTMTSINLAWTASTDNLAVAGYRVYRNGVLVASPTVTSYTDTGLAAQTSYNYTIAAFDTAGNASAQSAVTAVSTLADTIAPSVPAGLSGSVSGKDIVLNWTASTDNVAVTQYSIYRNGTQIASSTTNSYVVLNALTGTNIYTVAARDARGNTSAQSTGVSLNVYVVSDINRDSRVDTLDLSTMLSNWNRTGVNTSDLNGDSVVNVLDLSTLLSNWTG